jgi:hypothetical protein
VRCITIEAAIDARVDFLLRDYDYFLNDPDWLLARLHALRNLQGSETIRRWRSQYTRAPLARSGAELLQLHYDPLYCRSQKQNYSGFAAPKTLSDHRPEPESHAAAASAPAKSRPTRAQRVAPSPADVDQSLTPARANPKKTMAQASISCDCSRCCGFAGRPKRSLPTMKVS